MKLAFLTNIPAPYRVEQFSELSKIYDVHFICDSISEKNRQWKINPDEFPFSFAELSGGKVNYSYSLGKIGKEPRQFHFSWGSFHKLKEIRPDIIISCELGMRTLQSIFYCRLFKIPLCLFVEATLYTERNLPLYKRFIRKCLLKYSSHFFCPGEEGKKYLQSFGVSKESITPYLQGSISNKYLSEVDASVEKGENLRNALNLKEQIFLFVGAFSLRKGIHQYLSALACLPEEKLKKTSFLFVGGGELRQEMEEFASKHHHLSICLVDFVQQEEIYPYYALADFFVLPSLEDVWGFVNLEASVAGLPQLFSKYSGSSSDLSKWVENPQWIDPFDVASFSQKILSWIENPPPRLEFSIRQKLAEFYSAKSQANYIHSGLQKAQQKKIN